MENKEIREKLLCVLRNNIQDLKRGCCIEMGDVRIYCNTAFVYKDTTVKEEVIEKPKYFWQKPKIKIFEHFNWEIDYTTFNVSYGNYETKLTKEEYNEISKIHKEKVKEKQLEELTKLCEGE